MPSAKPTERSLRFTDATSDKFWSASLSGRTWSAHWGRAGTTGQRKTHRFGSEEAARADFERGVAAKLAKGYVERRTATPRKAARSKSSQVPGEGQLVVSAVRAAHAKQRTTLTRLMTRAKLPDEARRAIEALIRPAILLRSRAARSSDLAVGATRFGGAPDLPASLAWPKKTAFIAQVRLTDVAPFDTEGRLPRTGWLWVFADRYLDRVVVHHGPSSAVLERREPPADADARYPAVGVDLRAELHLPPPASCYVGIDAPKHSPGSAKRLGSKLALRPEVYERYQDDVWLPWTRKLTPQWRPGAPGHHRMLGYYAGIEPGPETKAQVALSLDSDARAKMAWGDESRVQILVDERSLAKGKIARVRRAW